MKSLLTSLALGSLLVTTPAADIAVIGNWSEIIDASNRSTGAGSNLASQFTSTAGVTSLNISNSVGGTWRVYARRAENTWHRRLKLSIRRSSTGSGPGTIAGGESFIQLTNTDTEIFSGSGDRRDIAIQAKLAGMSVEIAPDVYSAGIIFTVVP